MSEFFQVCAAPEWVRDLTFDHVLMLLEDELPDNPTPEQLESVASAIADRIAGLFTDGIQKEACDEC